MCVGYVIGCGLPHSEFFERQNICFLHQSNVLAHMTLEQYRIVFQIQLLSIGLCLCRDEQLEVSVISVGTIPFP